MDFNRNSFQLQLFTMFYILLIVGTFLQVESFEHIYCKQKAMPKDALASFRDNIPNLQTGTLQVDNPKLGSRYTSFNVTIRQQISNNYSLSVSVQNIYDFAPKDSVDFQVTAIKGIRGFTGEVVMDVAAGWGWISICYVASGRADFSVGNFIADNSQFLSPTSNFSEVLLIYPLPVSQKITGKYLYAVPFVSGMRTFDQHLTLSFINSSFNTSFNSLNLSIQTRYLNYPLEFLGISYLIFSMASELQITSIDDIYFIPTSVNTFLGVSDVSSSPGLFNKTTPQTVKPLLEATSGPNRHFQQMFGINGIIVQTQQSIDVLYLPVQDIATTLSCVSKTTCSNYGGTMLHQQESVYDISSQCKTCPKNSYYNATSDECQCSQGFTSINGSCVETRLTCLLNQIYNVKTKSCICAALYVRVNGSCVSIFGACPENQIYFQGKCIQVVINQPTCRQGYLRINGVCQKSKECLAPQVLDNTTNTCICPNGTQLVDGKCSSCSVNETLIPNGCVCKDGYFRIGDKCLKCSPNAYYDGKKCICLKLYSGDGFNCSYSGATVQTRLSSEAPLGSYGGGIIINPNP